MRWIGTRHALQVAVVALTIVGMPGSLRSNGDVDLILILAIDVSGSVDRREFALQRTGFAKAFRDPRVVEAIAQGKQKSIAVMVVQWAGFREQIVAVPWAVISSANDAQAYADRLEAMPRYFDAGVTHISGLIDYASKLSRSAPFSAGRRVVDISGDGKNNVNEQPPSSRRAAVRSGLTINGLAILNQDNSLEGYYRDKVIGGPHAFVVTAKDYYDFEQAILRKLIREISLRFLF